jgi:hypothetical protein
MTATTGKSDLRMVYMDFTELCKEAVSILSGLDSNAAQTLIDRALKETGAARPIHSKLMDIPGIVESA